MKWLVRIWVLAFAVLMPAAAWASICAVTVLPRMYSPLVLTTLTRNNFV